MGNSVGRSFRPVEKIREYLDLLNKAFVPSTLLSAVVR